MRLLVFCKYSKFDVDLRNAKKNSEKVFVFDIISFEFIVREMISIATRNLVIGFVMCYVYFILIWLDAGSPIKQSKRVFFIRKFSKVSVDF